MGPAWLTGRKTERSQAAGWKFKIFFLSSFLFSQPPPLQKRTHFTLVLLHSFLGVPFMTVRLQVHSPFSFSTWTFPSLILTFLSPSPSPLYLSLVLYFCIACRMTGNLFFLIGHNNISSFLLGFFSERNFKKRGLIFTALNNQIFVKRKGEL